MFRFFTHLLGKPFEECKGCEILKQQLAIANEEKKQLTDTLISILKPEIHQAPVVETRPISVANLPFTKRRAILEASAREAARVKATSPFIAKQDKKETEPLLHTIDNLEQEVGLKEEIETNG